MVATSSTIGEVVGTAEELPDVLWARNFLISQGFDVKEAIVYQDNRSAIALAERGRPASRRTRHIDIRYFFVKESIDKKEVKLIYLPTEHMVADFFTKPLQGKAFLQHRDVILGYKEFNVNQLPA